MIHIWTMVCLIKEPWEFTNKIGTVGGQKPLTPMGKWCFKSPPCRLLIASFFCSRQRCFGILKLLFLARLQQRGNACDESTDGEMWLKIGYPSIWQWLSSSDPQLDTLETYIVSDILAVYLTFHSDYSGILSGIYSGILPDMGQIAPDLALADDTSLVGFGGISPGWFI